MRLHGKNFQPWAEFNMEIDGLTVLVGPSNQGKSSLFRALKGILRNDIPEEFVRNKQDEPLEISLTLDDGRVVKAVRPRGKSTKYFIFPPGETDEDKASKYTSLGGKLPDEIKKLGFDEVKIGDYTIDPIFAGQNKAQFLIDSDRWKANELNAILGAFSSTEKLDAGKKEANLRISQRKSEASTLASEIRSAEERGAELLKTTGQLTVVEDAVAGLEIGIRGDHALAVQLGSTALHLNRLEPLQTILNALTLPDLAEVTTLASKAENLFIAADSSGMLQFLRLFESALDDTARNWKGIVSNYKQVTALEDLLVLLQSEKGSSIEVADSLSGITKTVGEQLTEVRTISNSISYLAEVIRSVQVYEKFTPALAEVDGQLEEAEQELESVRQEAAAETARKQAASKLCPKCGKGLEHVCQ